MGMPPPELRLCGQPENPNLHLFYYTTNMPESQTHSFQSEKRPWRYDSYILAGTAFSFPGQSGPVAAENPPKGAQEHKAFRFLLDILYTLWENDLKTNGDAKECAK
jgi:hypothetical protein